MGTLPPVAVELGPIVLDALSPAGLPGVELGLLFDRQLPSSFPSATIYVTVPPVPLPRESPPISRNVVPARRFAWYENPVPVLESVVIVPSGTTNDCPPGITPKKFGLLQEAICITQKEDIDLRRDSPLYCRLIPPYSQVLALHHLSRRGRDLKEEVEWCRGRCVKARIVARIGYHYGSAGSSRRKT